jgi:hypothetical protein
MLSEIVLVRPQQYRRRKYEAKIDGDVFEKRADAYGSSMKTEHATITAVLVAKEEEAKTTILEPAGVGTAEMPFYLNAMREFCKCCRTFTSVTRNNKCFEVLNSYRNKGLQIGLLYKLAAMCGCYPAGYGYYV